ncbi:MAG: hypothetical protein KGL55_13320 [Rhodospirillales bacterium]|nr:hypothetical protein [Rhodospirillales bacterium]
MPPPPSAEGAARAATWDDPDLALLAAHVDVAHYLASYPDIAASGLDPVAHYHAHGWREGRDPTTWFVTADYLAAYPDIRDADIDPLLHFLRHGAGEGRQPRRPGGDARRSIACATPPAEHPTGDDAPAGAALLDAAALAIRLDAACAATTGLVLAASHDRYIDVTGGVQIFIADEQARFAAGGAAYLHLAPAVARPTLVEGDGATLLLQLVLDGRFVGLATLETVVAALRALPAARAPRRLLVVHAPFGHSAAGLAALAHALAGSAAGAVESFFWLHDYGSLCEGYNLLRNDAVFCGAPAAESDSCRVCVYGARRGPYREALRALFEAVGFHVLAPSQAALDLWTQAAGLPHRSARVHANARLLDGVADQTVPPRPVLTADAPVRVAFVGYPMAHKGWPAYRALVEQMRGDGRYLFHHFANADSLVAMDGLRGIACRVNRHDRLAMVRTLAEHGIDLVLVLSPWPETFSYVTFEAFAAGAEVVTLAASGNVADAVRRHGRGLVLADGACLLACFAGGAAQARAVARRADPRPPPALDLCGTTATLDPLRPEATCPTTTDPALRVLAGGQVIHARRLRTAWRFTLPHEVGEIRLLSRHTVPPLFPAGTADPRRRGVAVARLTLDGEVVPPGDARRLGGWHGADDAWEWTSGDATIVTGGAEMLEIELGPACVYPLCPLLEPG